MEIKVLFFAVLRERAGADSVTIQLEKGATLDDLKNELVRKYGQMLKLNKSIVYALNGTIVRGNVNLKNNDKVALLPPVSGGSND
jgi:molybdopterin synthase catalytic subunit